MEKEIGGRRSSLRKVESSRVGSKLQETPRNGKERSNSRDGMEADSSSRTGKCGGGHWRFLISQVSGPADVWQEAYCWEGNGYRHEVRRELTPVLGNGATRGCDYFLEQNKGLRTLRWWTADQLKGPEPCWLTSSCYS